MRLALKLGYADVDSVLTCLTSSQFVEWQKFYYLEPFGAQADEMHLAAIRALVTNYFRPSSEPAYKLRDFLLCAQPKEREPTVEELYQKF